MRALLEQIKEQAAGLTRDERAELAYFLLTSLEPEDEGMQEAWNAEIARRAEEVRNGTAVGIPSEEVFAEMRVAISRHRKIREKDGLGAEIDRS